MDCLINKYYLRRSSHTTLGNSSLKKLNLRAPDFFTHNFAELLVQKTES